MIRPLPLGEIVPPLGRLYIPPLSLVITPLGGLELLAGEKVSPVSKGKAL